MATPNAAERQMAQQVKLTPEEEARALRQNKAPANIAELQREIARTSNPEHKGILMAELSKATGESGDLPLPGVDMAAVKPVSTSSSTTITKKSGPGIAAAQMKLEEYVRANADIRTLLEAATTDHKAATTVVSDATLAAGNAQADSINATGNAEASQLEFRKQAVDFFSAGLGSEGELMKAKREQLRAQGVMDQLRPRIDAEMQVTVFDDPLRWAINQFTLPTLKGAFNAASRANKSMEMRIAGTQAQVAQQLAIDTGVSVEQVRARTLAEAQKTLFNSVRDAAIVRNQGAAGIAQSIMQQASLASADLNAHMSMARLLAESHGYTLTDKADEKIKPTVDAINVKLQAAGLPALSLEEFKSLSGPERSELTKRGMLPQGQFGTDIGDSFRFLKERGALATLPASSPAITALLQSQLSSTAFETRMQAEKMNPKFAGADVDEQRARVLELVAADELKELKKKGHYDRLDKESPHKVKIGTAVLYPELKDNIFSAQVKEQLKVQSYQGEIEPKVLERAAVAMVLEEPGKASMVAKELSDFYRTAQMQQWTSGAAALGYTRPTEYKTSTMTIGGKPVNQWNPVEIEHWLVSKRAEHAQSFGQRGLGVIPDAINRFQKTTQEQVGAQQAQYKKDIETAKGKP